MRSNSNRLKTFLNVEIVNPEIASYTSASLESVGAVTRPGVRKVAVSFSFFFFFRTIEKQKFIRNRFFFGESTLLRL